MNYTILGQTIEIISLLIGIGLGLVLAFIITFIAKRSGKRKVSPTIKEILEEIEKGHLNLAATNKILQGLYNFFDGIEKKGGQDGKK